MARPLLVSVRVACTADRGQGATVFSPLSASPAGVRVSVTFSSRRPPKRLSRLPAAPVQNRRRPGRPFIKEKCFFGTACPTVLSACRFFVATPRLASIVHRRVPGTPSHLASGRCRGSLPIFNVGMRRNGGGFAPPSPSQSRATVTAKSSHREHRDPVTQQV